MSSATVRAEIAAAATLIEGVNVSPYYRQSLKPGDGFVRLGQRGRDGSGIGFLDTWEIWLALSQDVLTAEQWLEDNLDDLLVSLHSAMYVTTVTPTELVIGTGGASIPGVIIAGTREAGA
jgi:hypothetical protein